MANITLRSVKGSALTFQEADDNFENLNTAKIESVADDTAPSLGGNLDIGQFAIASSEGVIQLEGGPIVAGSFEFDVGVDISAITSPATSIGLFLGHNLLDEQDPGSSIEFFQDSVNILVNDNDVLEFQSDEILTSIPLSLGGALRTNAGVDLELEPAAGRIIKLKSNTQLEGDFDLNTQKIFNSQGTVNLDGIVSLGSIDIGGPRASILTTDATANVLALGLNVDLTAEPRNPLLIMTDNDFQFDINDDVPLEINSDDIIVTVPIRSEDDFDLNLTAGQNGIIDLNGPVTINGNTTFNNPINSTTGIVTVDANLQSNNLFGPNDSDFSIVAPVSDPGLTGLPTQPGEILLSSGKRVSITDSPFQVSLFTTTQRDSITEEVGDIIFNNTTDQFQGRTNQGWQDLRGVQSDDVFAIVKLTQAQYDAIQNPVTTTLYLIEEE